jgi:hypothetical protein
LNAPDTKEVTQTMPESGEHLTAKRATPLDEKRLRDAAFHAIGSYGDDDEDQVLSCLDALADDLRVLEAALAGDVMVIDVENSIGRFVGRAKAIRQLHVELAKQRDAVPSPEAVSSFSRGVAVGEERYRAAFVSCFGKTTIASKAIEAGHLRKAAATLDEIQADIVKLFEAIKVGDRMTAELDEQVAQ